MCVAVERAVGGGHGVGEAQPSARQLLREGGGAATVAGRVHGAAVRAGREGGQAGGRGRGGSAVAAAARDGREARAVGAVSRPQDRAAQLERWSIRLEITAMLCTHPVNESSE